MTNAPRRTLYVYDGKMTGVGIDAVVQRQLAALAAHGGAVDLVARGRVQIPGVTNHCARYTPANLVSWLPRRFYYPAQKRHLSRRASRLLERQNYDAVVSWPQRALHPFRRARVLGLPCFLNCDTMHYLTGRRAGVKTWWPEYSPAEREEEYTLATQILAPSDFSRDTFLRHGLPAGKVTVIGRGVDTQRYQPATCDDPQRPFRLVFCGRVSERKGIRQITDAWKSAALYNAELWIIGEVASEVADLAIQGIAGVTFFGFRTDAETLIRQCDAQILLSRHEGMAKGLLEGAACGLATLATAHCGFPLVENQNGFLVERKDPVGTAKKLRQLYEDRDLCRAMGRHARTQIVADYSWESFARRFLAAVALPSS